MATSNILVVDMEDRLRVLLHEVGDLKSVVRLLEKRVAQLEELVVNGRSGAQRADDNREIAADRGIVADREIGADREIAVSQPLDLASVEKSHILRVLQYTGGNKVEAARLLNIGLTTVYRKMETYGLD